MRPPAQALVCIPYNCTICANVCVTEHSVASKSCFTVVYGHVKMLPLGMGMWAHVCNWDHSASLCNTCCVLCSAYICVPVRVCVSAKLAFPVKQDGIALPFGRQNLHFWVLSLGSYQCCFASFQPHSYFPHCHCTWIFTVKTGIVIQLKCPDVICVPQLSYFFL